MSRPRVRRTVTGTRCSSSTARKASIASRLEGAYPSPASDAMLQTLEDVAEEFREAKLELAG